MPKEELYWLVKGDRLEEQWRKVLTKADGVDLLLLQEHFQDRLIHSVLQGEKKNWTVDQIQRYSDGYPAHLQKYLDEGKILLINTNGGYMFYYEGMTIVEERLSTTFPVHENRIGLTGWLSPSGQFYPCKYGEHSKFANTYKGADLDYFLCLSSSGGNYSNSVVYGVSHKYTDEQEAWLMKNFQKLDPEQTKMVVEYLNMKTKGA